MRYAVIENATVINVILAEANEANLHANLVATETAEIGDTYTNGLFDPARTLPLDPEPAPRTWSVGQVRASLTLAERVKWDNDKTDTIKTAKVELATPQGLDAITEVLQMLVDAADISQASMNKVLA